MRLLLDTNVVLWSLGAPARLGRHAQTIGDPAHDRVLSAVVIWEVAIKMAVGRLHLGVADVGTWAARAAADLEAHDLAIERSHAVAVATLPLHHRDPFDRMLVAQAQVLGATLVTADATLRRYEVDVLVVD